MSGSNQKQLERFDVEKRISSILTGEGGDQSLLFKPSEMQQTKQAKDSVNKAIQDNKMIEFALKDKQYQLDATDYAKLESVKGRNLSHILLNSHRYRKDSDEMKAVKDSVKALEEELLKPIEFKEVGNVRDENLNEDQKKQKITDAMNNTEKMIEIEKCYRDAIKSCTKYLKKKKNPKSDKGIERYNLVKEKRTNLINEFNQIAVAKQLVWRGLIGNAPTTAKDLLVEQKDYTSKHKILTQEEKDGFEKADRRCRSFRSTTSSYPSHSEDNQVDKEGQLLIDVFNRKALPNALIESLGTSKEDKRRAVSQINMLWKALSLFEDNKLQSITISVGESIFSLFQKEDNTLDLIYSHCGLNGMFVNSDKSCVTNLRMSARSLATVLGKNMIENEEIFGKAQTTKIMDYTRSIDKNANLAEKSHASDIGNSYLIKRLGVSNIDFTNIPPEEVLKKAKDLEAGLITKTEALQWVKDYEYGGTEVKEIKEKARKKELEKKKLIKSEHDIGEKRMKGKTVDELIKEEEINEELEELTRKENEELMKKATKQKVVTQAQKKIDSENIKKDTKERRQKIKDIKNPEAEDKQIIEIDKSFDEAINVAIAKYDDQIKKARADLKTQSDSKREEINRLIEEREGDIQKAGERFAKSEKYGKELEDIYNSFIEIVQSVEKLGNLDNEAEKLSEQEVADLKVRFAREYAEEKERIVKRIIDERIAQLQNELSDEQIKCDKLVMELEAQKFTETDPLEKQRENELGLLEGWRDYNKSVTKPEDKITFEQWKEKLKQDYEKRQREEEAKKAKKERDKEKLERYKDLTLEIQELEEKDVTKITDEKINGQDTLDLLKHREKIIADKKLSTMILYTEDLEAKRLQEKEKENKDKAENYKAQIKSVEEKIAAAVKTKKEFAPDEEKIQKNKDRIKAIDLLIPKHADTISGLTVELDQKIAYMESPDYLKDKDLETAAYLKAKDTLSANLAESLEKIDARINSEGKDSITEDHALLLKNNIVRDYQAKKGKIEEEYAAKKKEWEQEPYLLYVIRGQISSLTNQVAEMEKERAELTAKNEELEKPILENSKQYKQLTDELAKLRREAEKNRREIEEREAEKLKQKKAEQKAAEEKEKAIEEGREWTQDEEELKNFVADILYSQTTWDMDNETKPGERIWNIIRKNSNIICKLAVNREKSSKLLKGFLSKLPVGMLGDSAPDLDKIINDIVDQMVGVAEKEYNEQLKEVEARDAIRKEHEQENEARRVIWQLKQDERRKEWEARKAEIEKKREEKNEADFKKYISEHPELQKLPLEEQRKQHQNFKNAEALKSKVSGFLSFFNLKKTEEKKEDDELKIEDFVEEEFVEEKYEDEYAMQDKLFKSIGRDALITTGINAVLNKKLEENEEIQEKIQEFVKKEKEIEKLVHKNLKSFEKTFSKLIQKELGGGQKEKKIESVPYYKEKGISAEEREARIKKGNEQMLVMMNNAMAGKEGQGQYLRNILSSYLAESSVLDLRSMFSSAIRNAKPAKLQEDASDDQKYEAMSSMLGGLLKGAGPLLQKVLQGMPEEMIPEGLKPAFSDMKDNLAPIPKEIVEAQLIGMIERSQGAITSIEITKSLGAASVGQAFLCKVHMNEGGFDVEQDVVIKLLRPDVRNRMLREERIMRKAAKNAGEGMLRTFEGQMEHIREELDLTIEAKNCETGQLYNMEKKDVRAMKVSRVIEPTANSLVINQAPGDTVVGVLKKTREEKEKYLKEYYTYDADGNVIMEDGVPKLNIPVGDSHIQRAKTELSKRIATLRRQQKMLTNMAKKWVTEAVFGNGFYHGDLHAGNIMMAEHRLTVIDFGNATQLTKHQQTMVTKMLLAAAAGSGEGFYEGFEGLLSEKSRELLERKGKELKEIFNEVMHLGDAKSAALRIGAALVRAQKLGFELPSAIYGFQQSQWRIQNTIDEFNKEIDELKKAMVQLYKADGDTKFDVSKKYMPISKDATKRQAMKFTLIPENTEEFRDLIRDKSENGRKVVDEMLGRQLVGIKDFLDYDDSILVRIKSQDTYDSFVDGCDLPVFFKASDLEADLKVYRETNDKDERIAALEAFKKKYREYDVVNALTNFRNAQDAGVPEDELKDLEDKVISAMTKVKAAFFETKKFNDDAAKAELKAQETEKNKFDEKKYDEQNTFMDSIDSLMADVKKNLQDVKLKDQAMVEFKAFFEDEKYGPKLKAAIDKYYEALEKKADNTEALLNEVIEALRMPILTNLTTAADLRADERRVDASDPDDFLGVMADVISDEWKKALKRIAVIDAVKYAWSINEDLTGQNLSFKDILQIFMG